MLQITSEFTQIKTYPTTLHSPLAPPPFHGSPIYSTGLAYSFILSPSLIHQPLLTYKKACLSSNYIKHFQFLCPWQYIVKKLYNNIIYNIGNITYRGYLSC